MSRRRARGFSPFQRSSAREGMVRDCYAGSMPRSYGRASTKVTFGSNLAVRSRSRERRESALWSRRAPASQARTVAPFPSLTDVPRRDLRWVLTGARALRRALRTAPTRSRRALGARLPRQVHAADPNAVRCQARSPTRLGLAPFAKDGGNAADFLCYSDDGRIVPAPGNLSSVSRTRAATRGRRTSTTSGFALRHGGCGSAFGSTDRVARSASSCLGPHRRQQPFSGPAKREAFRFFSGSEQHRRLGVHEIGKARHLGTAPSRPADARPAQGNLRRFCCEEIAGSD